MGGGILLVLAIKPKAPNMNPEKSFNPSNPEYKEVKDLPQEVQEDFIDVDGGFVRKEAAGHAEDAGEDAALSNKRRGIIQKLFNVSEMSELSVLHEEAISEDKALDNAKHEERIRKEEEEHVIASQARAEKRRVQEEKWKSSEEFKKLSLFKEFWEMKPNLEREVLPVLKRFSEDANIERSEDSYRLFREARKLTYKNILPMCFNDSGELKDLVNIGVFDIPSDWRTIEDDKEFAESIAEKNSGTGISLYDFSKAFGRPYLKNFSLFSAIIPQYAQQEGPIDANKAFEELIRFSQPEHGYLPGYCPVDHLKYVAGVTIEGHYVVDTFDRNQMKDRLNKLNSYEEKRQESMAMNKKQYAAFLESQRVADTEHKKKKELERVTEENARREVEKTEAEKKAMRSDLKKKLLD